MSQNDEATERDPLLDPASINSSSSNKQQHHLEDPDTDDSIAQDPSIVLPHRRWIMEPVILLFCVGILSQAPVLSQYIYYRIGRQFNSTANSSRAFVCDRSALWNSSEHSLTNRIQSEASSWTLYRSIVSSTVALLVLPLYGSASDYWGRKPTLLLPAVGILLDSAGVLLVVLLDLPLIGLVISSGVGALGGGFGTLLAAVFAYLADTTSRKSRPIRVAIVEGMFGIAGTVMELVMGWWIKLMGYAVPLIFSAAVLLANLLYVIFFVPEVRVRTAADSNTKASTTTRRSLFSLMLLPFVNIASLFGNNGKLTILLALVLSSMGIFTACFMGSSTVGSLYQMNYPFCLDSVFIGYLSSAKIVGYQIGAVFGLLVVRKYLGVRTIGLIVLGLVSSAAGSLITGLAQSTVWLFAASGAALFSMLAVPMFRAYASQIAPPERQGALFSCIGVLEVGGNLAGSTAFISLYRATLEWMPGFVYLVVAAITAVSLLLSSVCLLLDTCWRSRTLGVTSVASGVDNSDTATSNDSTGAVNS